MKFSQRRKGGQPSFFLRIICLAIFFAGGVFWGQFSAGRVPDEAGQELTEYLRQYMLLGSDRSVQAAVSTLILYLRYPLVAVLLGFASVGVVFIPSVAAAFGFFVSFSVSCFTAVFGTRGVWLAMAAFGFRCAITIPCFLMLAGPSWGNAASLAALSFGRGRRVSPVIYGRSWWIRIVVCLGVLLMGVCVDFMIAPWCLHWALDQIPI